MKHLALCAGAAALYILISASSIHAWFVVPDLPISTAARDQERPSVAYDPVAQRFLVAWGDNRSGTSYDIYGQIVSSDGTLLGENFTISTAARNQFNTSVAYDPVAQGFLVVWDDNRSVTSYDIYGQLISPDGTLLGGDFTISTASRNQDVPSVAYDPIAQRFLVAWADYRSGTDYDIYGQIVSPDGTLLGENFTISTLANDQDWPSVANDSVSQRFLVTWEDYRSGTEPDIYGQIVSSDGTLLGENFTISTAARDQYEPSLAYDPLSQRFLVTWEDFRSGRDFFIYGQLVSPDGTLIGANFTISTAANDQYASSVAYDSVAQHFLVVWQDSRSGTSCDIYGQIVSPDGTLMGEDFTISTAADDEYEPSLAYDPVGQRFLLAWIIARSIINNDILGRLLKEGDITSAKLPSGTTYIPYTALLQATGGTLPYSWSLSSGALPLGLTLSSTTGEITGIPTMSGLYPFEGQVTDADGWIAISPLNIAVSDSPLGGNQPPTVSLSADPIKGEPPLAVTFTVIASDPDGTITQYRWDFNGDGTLDLITTTTTATYTYTTPGVYLAVITAADDLGATAFAYSMINVLGPSPTERIIEKQGCGCTLAPQSSSMLMSSILLSLLPLIYTLWRKRLCGELRMHFTRGEP